MQDREAQIRYKAEQRERERKKEIVMARRARKEAALATAAERVRACSMCCGRPQCGHGT